MRTIVSPRYKPRSLQCSGAGSIPSNRSGTGLVAMCGIAGFFYPCPIPRAVPMKVLKILEARGPDAQNAVLWDAAFQQAGDYVSNGLLNTRLAIIDPRPVANQPMCNASQDV